MIHSPIPAGISGQGLCADCSASAPLPGHKAVQGAFHRVLHALLAGGEGKAAGALPVQGAVAGQAGLPGEPETAAVEDLLRVATLAAEGSVGAPDSTRDEAAPSAVAPTQPAGQSAPNDWVGALQALPQAATGGVVLPKPGSEVARGVAATLAGGRQHLPPPLPADTTLPGQMAQAVAQADGEAVLPSSVLPEMAQRPALLTMQAPAEPPGQVVPERALEPARMAIAREVLTMQLPLRTQGWDGELAQRLVWMAGRQAQWAEITLNPPNLGSLEVHLSLKGNDASAYFYSPHVAVREAIDESLSRLREMLAGVGISLGQTQVSQQSFGERHGGKASGYSRPDEAGSAAGVVSPASSGRGLVDLYV